MNLVTFNEGTHLLSTSLCLFFVGFYIAVFLCERGLRGGSENKEKGESLKGDTRERGDGRDSKEGMEPVYAPASASSIENEGNTTIRYFPYYFQIYVFLYQFVV
jgi:hypothetical protein